MPQSLSNLLVHVVFSTKNRTPAFSGPVRDDVHAYLAGVVRGLKCQCFRVGGTADHVHMAVRMHQTVSLSEFIEKVKSSSSRALKTKSPDLECFSWQRGYGALSLGQDGLTGLIQYIERQEDHHRKLTFQEEFRALMYEHGVEFDERYVWD
jgi:putative transposase